MVPDIAKAGFSFKGAMAYYLHDKGQQTAERVAWTETRNLATDNPDAATRIMIATASHADELKAAAGVKATGRKSKAHVYAFSLAWHPDEKAKLTREHMLSCADEALKVLGAQGRQALIVCHQDEPQPHVHVIVNRVDPKTGIMLDTGNDRLKLGDWALDYRRKRGEELKYCPKREEKRQLRQKFADKTQRQTYAAERMAQAKQSPAADKSPAAMLREFQTQQGQKHKGEWADLSAQNKAARSAIYAEYDGKIAAALAEAKAAAKPQWAAVFKQERASHRIAEANERSLTGILRNAYTVALSKLAGGQAPDRGALGLTFDHAMNGDARRQALGAIITAPRAELAKTLRQQTDARIAALKAERAQALAAQRQAYNGDRAALIERQDAERAKIRQAWQQIGRDRSFPKNGPDRAQPQQEKPVQKTRAQRVDERSNPNNLTYQRRLDRKENRGVEIARQKQVKADRALSQAQQKPRNLDKPALAAAPAIPAPPRPDFAAASAKPAAPLSPTWQQATKPTPAQTPTPATHYQSPSELRAAYAKAGKSSLAEKQGRTQGRGRGLHLSRTRNDNDV